MTDTAHNDAALQELRKRFSLPPSVCSTASFEPTPVVPSSDRMPPIPPGDPLPSVFVGCSPVLRDMPYKFELTDFQLCRFLRARQYDVDKAEKMCREALKNREDWQLDTILNDPDPLEELWQRCAPLAHYGYDKGGRPVIIERSGEVRVGSLMAILTKEDFFYRHLRHMETVERRVRYAAQMFARPVQQVIIIMDLANLSFKPDRHAIPLFKQTVAIDTNFYPEMLGAFFIINAPWIFKPLWAIVRPWLDPRTQKKFHILGSDYRATLLQYIDADQLPEEYGGTNPEPVPPFKHLPDNYVVPARTRHQIEGMKRTKLEEE